MTAGLNWKNGQETCLQRKPHKKKGDGTAAKAAVLTVRMKKPIFGSVMFLCALMLSGCSISFSDGISLSGESTEETSLPTGAVEQLDGNEIEMQDITLRLLDKYHFGTDDMEIGKVYYVWNTDEEYILPTDSDVIMYIYEGTDLASPDSSLEEADARISMTQNYVQIFRQMVSGSVICDPQAILNGEWYALQITGNSGEYLFTTYNTLCYPKQYYGIYAVQNTTDEDSNHRRYYGFVFSNDSTGNIITEQEYNSLIEQIKEAFTISTFYTNPQNEAYYDPAIDYSKGYSYSQIETLFKNTENYYVMLKEQQAAEASKEQEEAATGETAEPLQTPGETAVENND